MTAEELRKKIMSRIDALLGRTFLVWGEDRALLSALRGYVASMPDAELDKVLTHYSYRERPVMETPVEHHDHDHDHGCDDHVHGCCEALQQLVCVAECLHQHCLACEGDVVAVDHCSKSLKSVMEAIKHEVACFEHCCGLNPGV
jgi:hypothetical protein